MAKRLVDRLERALFGLLDLLWGRQTDDRRRIRRGERELRQLRIEVRFLPDRENCDARNGRKQR